MAQAFISYSRKDKNLVSKLYDALLAQQREAWIDWKDIPLTVEWQQEIFTNIDSADYFIFVISPDSAGSRNCRTEIDHAVANNKRMIPILYRPVLDEAIPEDLGRFQRIDFGDNDNFQEKFAALITALDVDFARVQMHTRLLTRAKEWAKKAKESSFLLRGKDLTEAEHWVAMSAEKEPKPTTLQSQYILASRQSETKRQRIIIATLTVSFVIAVGLAIYAVIQKNVAERNGRESKARELTALATASLDEDRQRSILLGMHAVNATLQFGESPIPAAEGALHEAFSSIQAWLTLKGHKEDVNSVAWSPDGKRLATGSSDRTIKVWDAAGGQELLSLKGHNGGVYSVAWSPDGTRLASGSLDGTVKIWYATGQELLTLKGHQSGVDSVAWSPDGNRLATGSFDNTAKVWNAASGEERGTLRGHVAEIYKLAWSPDGKRLATASVDRTIKVWNVAGGQELLTLRGHKDRVYSVAWSPDGKWLATGSLDHTAKIWNADDGQELITLVGHTNNVSSVAWSPDGNWLATGSYDQTVMVWEVDNGEKLLTLKGHTDSVSSVEWSPDGHRLATGSLDRTAKVWDARRMQELMVLKVILLM